MLGFCKERNIDADSLPFFGVDAVLTGINRLDFDTQIPEGVVKWLHREPVINPKAPKDLGKHAVLRWPQTLEELVLFQRNATPNTLLVMPVSWQPMVQESFHCVTHNPWFMTVGKKFVNHNKTSFALYHSTVRIPKNPYEMPEWPEGKALAAALEKAVLDSTINKTSTDVIKGKNHASAGVKKSGDTKPPKKGSSPARKKQAPKK